MYADIPPYTIKLDVDAFCDGSVDVIIALPAAKILPSKVTPIEDISYSLIVFTKRVPAASIEPSSVKSAFGITEIFENIENY